jgi:hypothetical protein
MACEFVQQGVAQISPAGAEESSPGQAKRRPGFGDAIPIKPWKGERVGDAFDQNFCRPLRGLARIISSSTQGFAALHPGLLSHARFTGWASRGNQMVAGWVNLEGLGYGG